MSLNYVFRYFPKDKRPTVRQLVEQNEHARYMFEFMEQHRELQRIASMEAIRRQKGEERRVRRQMKREKKRQLKKIQRQLEDGSDADQIDSGVGSSVESGKQSPITSTEQLKLVPNPFYIRPPVSQSPPTVVLVQNPFYIPLCPVGLVPNPFYIGPQVNLVSLWTSN